MKSKTVLVVAAHPDDEVLGCGGTIAWHRRQRHVVHLIVMADGVTSRKYNPNSKVSRDEELRRNRIEVAKRKKEMIKSAQLLGIEPEHIYHFNLADQRLDQYPLLNLVKRIEKIKQRIHPDIVYTHFWNDFNLDHRVTFQAVATSFRPQPNGHKTALFQFEIPESTYLSIPERKKAFIPDYFVNVSETLNLKLKALDTYESERRPYPDLRSVEFIKKLAQKRGKVKKLKYAEAFLRLT